MRRGIRTHHADKRNLCPHDKAKLVTRVIKILRMLVMRQTDCVGTQLFYHSCVPVVILPCQRIALVEHILMAAHPTQRRRNAIQEKSFVRVTRKTPHSRTRRHHVIRLIAPLYHRRHAIQIRLVTIPQNRIWHIEPDGCTVRRAHAVCHLFSVCITDTILYRKILICIHDPCF